MKKYLGVLAMIIIASGLFAQPTRPTRPERPIMPARPEMKTPEQKHDFMYYNMQVSRLYREVVSSKSLSKQDSVSVGRSKMKIDSKIKNELTTDVNAKIKVLLATIDSLKIEAEKL